MGKYYIEEKSWETGPFVPRKKFCRTTALVGVTCFLFFVMFFVTDQSGYLSFTYEAEDLLSVRCTDKGYPSQGGRRWGSVPKTWRPFFSGKSTDADVALRQLRRGSWHPIETGNATMYVISAFLDARFQLNETREVGERIVVLAAADGAIREIWDSNLTAKTGPVVDDWRCLLCAHKTDGKRGKGKKADFTFKAKGKKGRKNKLAPLQCWWSQETTRSYDRWMDTCGRASNMAQYECDGAPGMPLSAITHVTIGNVKWNQSEAEAVMMAPLVPFTPYHDHESSEAPAKRPRGTRAAFERFRRVEPIDYVPYKDPTEGAQWKGRGSKNSAGGKSGGGSVIANQSIATQYTKPRISICTGPIYNNGSRSFMEWMEFTKMMGAHHVHAYYVDDPLSPIDESTKWLLNFYSARGDATMYHWDLPFAEVGRTRLRSGGLWLWAHGQTAMIMDCYYRASANSDWVVWLDVDEFLAPTKVEHSDWFEAMKDAFANPKMGVMKFQNWFYHPEERHPDGRYLHSELVTSSVFTKRKFVGGPTKCMARAGSVRSMGIHKPAILTPGYKQVTMGWENIHFRHYRTQKLKPDEVMTDFSMLRYQDELWERFTSAKDEFREFLKKQKLTA